MQLKPFPLLILILFTTACAGSTLAQPTQQGQAPVAGVDPTLYLPTIMTQQATSTPTPQPPSAPPSASFTQQPIDTLRHGQHVNVVDLNNDGRQEIILSNSLDDTILLYRNGGSPSFSPINVAPLGSIVAMETAVSDLDNDGDPDIAAVGLFDREPCGIGSGTFCEQPGVVTWYENTSRTWVPHTINTTLWGARSLALADLTGNSLPDLIIGTVELFGREDGLFWLRNDGNGRFSAPLPLGNDLGDLTQVAPHDVDGDGVPDIVAASTATSELLWLENGRSASAADNNPTFTRHTIATPTAVNSFAIGQLDEQLDRQQIVSVSASGILLHVAPADVTQPWATNPIDPDYRYADGTRIVVADFDGSGTPDIAVSSYVAGDLRWVAQTATAEWRAQPISRLSGVTSLAVGDFNQDGRPDLTTTTYEHSSGTDRLDWWQNQP